MKTLNRPMFRYGGPIKEGIMNGMKEKQAINTVGSPLAPKDETGRGGYAIPLLYGAGMAALRFLPAAYRGFRAARAYTPLSQNLGVGKRLLDIITPKKGLSAPMAPTGAGAGFRVGSLLRSNPLSLGLPAASLGVEAGTKAIKGIAQATPDLLKSYANTIIPFADPFTVGEKPPTTEGEKTGLKRGDKNKNVGDITGTTKPGEAGGATVKTDAEKQQITEDRIQATKDRYYKLMGIDKMNKEATYDSLIDASKIIQAEGGDLKGAIKSGSLQSQLISAISKNLDKSSDLKKKIDAAVLQAEIQKDVNKTKMSDFDKQLAILGPEGYRKKALGETSVADMVAATKAKGTLVNSDIVSSFIESKGGKVTDTFDDTKFQKWEKNNTGKDEIDYITENFSTIDPGVYVVNGRAVQIGVGEDGKKTANYVSLDTIIG
jgi:hypothetical protein